MSSTAYASPAPIPDPAARPARADRTPLLGRLLGGGLLAALVAGIAIAAWPASETDKARDDGERFGAAVAALYVADSPSEVDAALVDMRDAAADTREHAGDAVADQVSAQADALDRAADGFAGERTADGAFEQDLYQAELDTAVDDLSSQADDFRAQGPEVQQAFWDGYETGVNGNAEPTTTSNLD
jgi:hypothetical protein